MFKHSPFLYKKIAMLRQSRPQYDGERFKGDYWHKISIKLISFQCVTLVQKRNIF